MLTFFSGVSKSDCVFGSPSSSSPLRPTGTFAQVNLAHAWAGSPWVSGPLSEHLTEGEQLCARPSARCRAAAGLALIPLANPPGSCLWPWCSVGCSLLSSGWLRMAPDGGACFEDSRVCLAFQLTCKVVPSMCLISALLGNGYGFKAVFRCSSFRLCKPVYFIF